MQATATNKIHINSKICFFNFLSKDVQIAAPSESKITARQAKVRAKKKRIRGKVRIAISKIRLDVKPP